MEGKTPLTQGIIHQLFNCIELWENEFYGQTQTNCTKADLSASYDQFLETQLNKFIKESHHIISLQNQIEYTFSDINLLRQALTHTSFSHEWKGPNKTNYERCEFLGDSILSTMISTYLYKNYPSLNEGQLSKRRDKLVNANTLFQLGCFLNLDKCCLLGRGQLLKSLEDNLNIISDIFESLFGAIYLDCEQDLALTSQIFMELIRKYEIGQNQSFFEADSEIIFDAPGALQQLSLANYQVLPKYEFRPIQSHPQQYEVKVSIKGILLGQLIGPSKKKIKKQLASWVLENQGHLFNPSDCLKANVMAKKHHKTNLEENNESSAK